MINYKKYFLLFEGVADTVNKHLTHLEELILTNKKEGAEID